MAITKQDVWRTANEIDAAGEKPTAVEIRRRLGTGSYTTITSALKDWRRPEDEENAELEPMPGEYQERIAQAGADLFAIALRIAEERFQTERDAWATERTELAGERDSALALADQVANDVDAAKSRIHALETENARLIEERAKAFALAEERARKAQEAREEGQKAERLAGRVDALESVIATLAPASKTKRKTPIGDAGDGQATHSVTKGA